LGFAWNYPFAERLHTEGMEWIMRIDLLCPGCGFQFSAPADASLQRLANGMIENGLERKLSTRACFKDMIAVALKVRGRLACPVCREALQIQTDQLLQEATV
jgi:hypothetical protein